MKVDQKKVWEVVGNTGFGPEEITNAMECNHIYQEGYNFSKCIQYGEENKVETVTKEMHCLMCKLPVSMIKEIQGEYSK